MFSSPRDVVQVDLAAKDKMFQELFSENEIRSLSVSTSAAFRPYCLAANHCILTEVFKMFYTQMSFSL